MTNLAPVTPGVNVGESGESEGRTKKPWRYFLAGALAALAVGAIVVSVVLAQHARDIPKETELPATQSTSPSTSTTTSTIAAVDMLAEIQASVAVVDADNSSGSGFLIAPETLLTSAHVIRYATQVTVRVSRERELTGTITHINPDADLALIAVPGFDSPALELSQDEVRAGMDCYVVGSPVGLQQSVTKGIISNPSRLVDGVHFVQIDAAVNAGNSGGPIVDAVGSVIGVVTMKLSDTEGMGFGVSSAVVADFVAETTRGMWAASSADPNILLARQILARRPGKDVFLPERLPIGWHVAGPEEIALLHPDHWTDASNPGVAEQDEYPGWYTYRVFFTNGSQLAQLWGDAGWDGNPKFIETGLTYEGKPWFQYGRGADGEDSIGIAWLSDEGSNFYTIDLFYPGSGDPDTLLQIAETMKRYSAEELALPETDRAP